MIQENVTALYNCSNKLCNACVILDMNNLPNEILLHSTCDTAQKKDKLQQDAAMPEPG